MPLKLLFAVRRLELFARALIGGGRVRRNLRLAIALGQPLLISAFGAFKHIVIQLYVEPLPTPSILQVVDWKRCIEIHVTTFVARLGFKSIVITDESKAAKAEEQATPDILGKKATPNEERKVETYSLFCASARRHVHLDTSPST